MIDTRSETTNQIEGLFGRVLDRVRENVNVNLACGEPRTIGDTTIIPIGFVGYGFGIGVNTKAGTDSADMPKPEGGGGGGGVWIQPIAVVTITNGKTKVIPVLDLARMIPAMISAVGKLALAVSRRAQGRSVFGPGSMTVPPTRRKHAVGGNKVLEEIDEKE